MPTLQKNVISCNLRLLDKCAKYQWEGQKIASDTYRQAYFHGRSYNITTGFCTRTYILTLSKYRI